MPIKLAFQDAQIRKVCARPISARRNYGERVALSIQNRIADLKAADSPLDCVDLGVASFKGDSPTQMILTLEDGFHMLIEVNNRALIGSTATVDWSQVSRVKIVSIERVHES
ncbi:hypothetical protein [Robbsia andropogonis]|nr:hypothetical protein [Robbsia andropogonis]